MMHVTHDQRRLLELCALRVDGEGVDWSLLAREAAQRGDLDRLYAGEVTESSELANVARQVLAMLGEGIEAARRWVDDELIAAAAADAHLVTVLDEDYPLNLREIPNLPPFLFVLGDGFTPGNGPVFNDFPSACIVGTRKPSAWGREEARYMARALAENDVVVVSALTPGINTEAHHCALKHGGRTLLVIACGISRIYLSEIEDLGEEARTKCTVVSPFWPTDPPDGCMFWRCSELTSGIAQGTIIVESSDLLRAKQQADEVLNQDKLLFLRSGLFVEHSDSIREESELTIKDVRLIFEDGELVMEESEQLTEADWQIIEDDELFVEEDGLAHEGTRPFIDEGKLVAARSGFLIQEGRLSTEQGKLIIEDGCLVTKDGSLVIQVDWLVIENDSLVTESGKFGIEEGCLVTKDGRSVVGYACFNIEDGRLAAKEGRLTLSKGLLLLDSGQLSTREFELFIDEGTLVSDEDELLMLDSGISVQDAWLDDDNGGIVIEEGSLDLEEDPEHRELFFEDDYYTEREESSIDSDRVFVEGGLIAIELGKLIARNSRSSAFRDFFGADLIIQQGLLDISSLTITDGEFRIEDDELFIEGGWFSTEEGGLMIVQGDLYLEEATLMIRIPQTTDKEWIREYLGKGVVEVSKATQVVRELRNHHSSIRERVDQQPRSRSLLLDTPNVLEAAVQVIRTIPRHLKVAAAICVTGLVLVKKRVGIRSRWGRRPRGRPS